MDAERSFLLGDAGESDRGCDLYVCEYHKLSAIKPLTTSSDGSDPARRTGMSVDAGLQWNLD